MSEKSQIIFMQARIIRLASEELGMSIQKINELFGEYDVLGFIEECFDLFHMEGDYAVFDDVLLYLKNKGVDINAGID